MGNDTAPVTTRARHLSVVRNVIVPLALLAIMFVYTDDKVGLVRNMVLFFGVAYAAQKFVYWCANRNVARTR